MEPFRCQEVVKFLRKCYEVFLANLQFQCGDIFSRRIIPLVHLFDVEIPWKIDTSDEISSLRPPKFQKVLFWIFTLCVFANFRIFSSITFLGTMFSCVSTVTPKKNVGILRIKRTKKMPLLKMDFLFAKKLQSVFTSIKTYRAIKPLLRTIWWSHRVQMLENRWIVS